VFSSIVVFFSNRSNLHRRAERAQRVSPTELPGQPLSTFFLARSCPTPLWSLSLSPHPPPTPPPAAILV
jgi:hypothetical protein